MSKNNFGVFSSTNSVGRNMTQLSWEQTKVSLIKHYLEHKIAAATMVNEMMPYFYVDDELLDLAS